MTLDFDPASDLAEVVDGLEAISVTRPGSSTVTAVSQALRSAMRRREAEHSNGKYTAGDVVWQIPASQLPDSPRLGDVIVDAAEQRWTVLDVRSTSLSRRWRCIARNIAVAAGLDSYVDIEAASYTKGTGGAEQATWKTWKTGIPARVQPVEMEVAGQRDRRVSRRRFTIFLAEDVTVDHTHRIKGSDSAVYRILGTRKSDRVDALLEIDAIRISVEE